MRFPKQMQDVVADFFQQFAGMSRGYGAGHNSGIAVDRYGARWQQPHSGSRFGE